MRARHPRWAGSDRGELRALASRTTSTAAGPCATCRQPSSRTAGFGARLCSLFHDRRFASLAVTEKTPVGFFFHRLVICLNSAGSPARPQVSLAGRQQLLRTDARVCLVRSFDAARSPCASLHRSLIARLSCTAAKRFSCSSCCRDPEADEAP